MRVLIIDDDRAHGESLADLLDSLGHEAYYGASLEDALWLTELFRFELAILDHDMPRHTGLQVAREILARVPGLPTALMSARRIEREALEEFVSTPFLAKPIDTRVVLELIRAIDAGTSLTRRLSFPLDKYLKRR